MIGSGNTRAYPVAMWVADRLSLAAAPVFALMAVLTAVHGGGAADILCATAHGGSPLNGMPFMYGLMSAVHAGPWAKLIAGR
jgi:hypothetical protein